MSRDQNNLKKEFDTLKWYSTIESKRLVHDNIRYSQLKNIAKQSADNESILPVNIPSRKSTGLEKNLIVKFDNEKPQLAGKTIQKIIAHLDKFEISKGFLKPSITLTSLASKLNTNSKYLSKTINQCKKKSFTMYINDLRIEYFINQLEKDKKFTNYTIKAIANELGFNTANAFSKAFFKKTGVYPSQFIKKLGN